MDNSFSANLKRGLRITYDYFISVIIFFAISMPIIAFIEENAATYVRWASFVVFILLFAIVYLDMRSMGFKEKRPQYDMNPKPYKGLIYGVIGTVPVVVMQIIIIALKPEDSPTFYRRVYQGFAGPIYWLARLLGNKDIYYILMLLVLILFSFLGYYAGHKDFHLLDSIRTKLGIKSKKINNNMR